MNYKNHIRTGILINTVFLNIYLKESLFDFIINNIDYTVALYIGTSIGAVLPDIDHKQSFISKKVNFFRYIVGRLFKHRYFTHSISFLTLLFVPYFILVNFFYIDPFLKYIYIGVIIGAFSHILMDMFIGNGVALFYPFKKNKIAFLKIKSNSFLEKIFIHFLIFSFFLFFIYYNIIFSKVK